MDFLVCIAWRLHGAYGHRYE